MIKMLGPMLALGVFFSLSNPLFAALDLPVGLPGAKAAPAGGTKEEVTTETLATKRMALRKEIAATRRELAQLPEGASSDAARWLTQETALLERLDAVHAEQERTWQHAADLAQEAASIEERVQLQRPPEASVPPPFDLPHLDRLYAERDYLELAAESLKRDVANTEAAVTESRDLLEERERERRAAREASVKVPGKLRLAELESRLAEETLVLREKALKTLKLQQSLLAPKLKLLVPQLAWLRGHLVLGPEDDSTRDALIQKRLAELDLALAATRDDAEKATQNVIVAERLATEGKVSAELEARRANRQATHLALGVLTAQRERVTELAEVTALRRRVLLGQLSTSELRTLGQENQIQIDQRTRERRRETTELFRSRRELQDWQGRLTRAASAEEKVESWGLERVSRLSTWIELLQAELIDLDRLRTERNRLQEEIGTQVNLFSWKDATAIAQENVVAAWNYEIFSVQDQPVRVKTILAVLLLVVVGYRVSRWLSELVSRTVFKRMGMNTGRRAAWQSLWFYALFVVVLVTAFNLFHISLTQFSVVSGALAVGIGFGSQNLISNFISGIILLIERPVNQGDVIEIDGRQVTVEQLGVRSTIVRTLDNTHMIVPNSHFLEQPVVNWTLSDEVVRQQISVGVAYDSPTRKVAALLQGVVQGIEHVQKEPAPTVKFSEFGDSSLVFVIYFWSVLSDRFEVENELRHRIAEVFTREKITMAFPQRDVHLTTPTPLQVVMTPPPLPAPPAGSPAEGGRGVDPAR